MQVRMPWSSCPCMGRQGICPCKGTGRALAPIAVNDPLVPLTQSLVAPGLKPLTVPGQPLLLGEQRADSPAPGSSRLASPHAAEALLAGYQACSSCSPRCMMSPLVQQCSALSWALGTQWGQSWCSCDRLPSKDESGSVQGHVEFGATWSWSWGPCCG